MPHPLASTARRSPSALEPTRRKRRRSLRLLLLVGIAWSLAPSLAAAWRLAFPIRVRVHEHTFDRVDLKANGCQLRVKLHFTAPQQAYAEPHPARNHYRFRARLRFANGRAVSSGLFFSRSPARRSYTFEADTASEGCWARAQQPLRSVDVEGCRGTGCKVRPFSAD